MKKSVLLILFVMSFALEALANRQMNSNNEGLILIQGQTLKFGVLGHLLHKNALSSLQDPQFDQAAGLINDPTARQESVVSALDRIADFHPILAKNLMEEFQKDKLPIKMIELYDDPFPLPEDLKTSTAIRLFMWSDIANTYLVDNHLYPRLSSLEQAKVSLFMLLEQLGFVTSAERLEAFVDLIFSQKMTKSDRSSRVAMAEEALNLRLSELPPDFTKALNQNWLKAEQSVPKDQKIECLNANDLSKDDPIEGQAGRTISLFDKGRKQKNLMIPSHELSYVYPIASAIGALNSAHQYQKLYGKGLGGAAPFETSAEAAKSTRLSNQVCLKRVSSPKGSGFVKLEAFVFEFSGPIDQLPRSLDLSIEKYVNHRNKLAAGALQAKYNQLDKDYLRTELATAERESLGEILNDLNIQILGIESGLGGSIVNIDSDKIKQAFNSKSNRFSYRIVISFANQSGPELELKDATSSPPSSTTQVPSRQ